MSHQLHLGIGINSIGYLARAWPYRTGQRNDFINLEHYERLTRLAHQGRFDAVFFSDHPALMLDATQRPLHSLDPLVLLAVLGARVPDIGLALTASSTYNSPYNLARRVATLDHLSGGRAILNIVSSFSPRVAQNFGADPLPGRDERYRRAHEFLEVSKALWGSWRLSQQDSDDPEHLWDRASARDIDHHGEFFDVRGPLNIPSSAQGYPVIAQAGASDQGIDLAAQHGELIYCSLLNWQAAAEFGARVRARASELGREPGSVRLLPGLVVITAASYEQALRRHEQVSGAGSADGLLARFAQEIGADLSSFDPDAVLDPDLFKSDPDQSRPIGFSQALVELLAHEPLTAREIVRRYEGGHRLVLGTPEQVAHAIIEWWEAGLVDGYIIQLPNLPDDLQTFVAQVVPILQAQGVYRRHYAEATVRQRFGLPQPF
ncbi:FMN-dependent oxidoreductase, nitrilotriacetate monooxygenase family [Lampropedia hyalina DSM 16112]|jgi:FMN-dependent oxidoreductase (nitrilotriacetate monooxygenase family)|uniref:FMN-dependent oxidoreductase, nitrilotriacetate monooxygenase family n=1 Tax=Lampropedia hyalina DSM 16112 TaxID=1122156 RepID=A0A1M4SM08_9BURK|nr:NtaA/DmoA family FMN-dependent monooxygenase [Lampropedia hyalina]SHE33236.1 FMN-dependent oxidoreductase, nitrilotriacetate monooxygenase family [Lampropedia hyalina DSM 16112]